MGIVNKQPAKLALEDGTVYTGHSFGAEGEVDGEVCFNTSMTGYQEILTDPSYRGQIVTMTYPLIGNYGINEEDLESPRPHLAGFIVRENSSIHSNFSCYRRVVVVSPAMGHCGSRGTRYPGSGTTDTTRWRYEGGSFHQRSRS